MTQVRNSGFQCGLGEDAVILRAEGARPLAWAAGARSGLAEGFDRLSRERAEGERCELALEVA